MRVLQIGILFSRFVSIFTGFALKFRQRFYRRKVATFLAFLNRRSVQFAFKEKVPVKNRNLIFFVIAFGRMICQICRQGRVYAPKPLNIP